VFEARVVSDLVSNQADAAGNDIQTINPSVPRAVY
jgi:hypothetical protein